MTVYTSSGKAWVAQKCQNVAPITNALQNIVGWGTGATAEAVGNTVLATEASEARSTGTLTNPTTTVANDTDQLVATIVCAGAGKTITEAGRFNTTTKAGGGEVMLERALFTGIPLLVGDSIQFTFTLAQG